MHMPDGTYCASNLKLLASGDMPTNAIHFNNVALRVGNVVHRYTPEDENNTSKRYIEYDVVCYEKNSDGAYIQNLYKNCITSIDFGGVADFTSFSLREQVLTQTAPGKYDTSGALVLLLCANGDSSQNVIIGALPHPKGSGDNPNNEHYYITEFNGVNVDINNDGEFVLTRKGATDINGKVKVESSTGAFESSLNLDKNGNIKINSGTSGEIDITSGADFNNVAEGVFSVDSNSCNIHTKGRTIVLAPEVNLTNLPTPATDFILKANPGFVSAFNIHETTLAAAMTSIAAAMTATAVAITNIKTFALAATPPMSSPQADTLTAAITALTTAVGITGAAVAGVTAFIPTMAPGIAISTTTKST